MAEFQTIFDTIKISPIIFWIIVIVFCILLIFFVGYFWFEYQKGSSLKLLFWARIKRWFNKRISLFEIFDITNTVRFEYGHREQGDTYKFGEDNSINNKNKGLLDRIFGDKNKSVENPDEIITPKSVYNINSVKTVPLFEPYPKLNPIIENGINTLISKGITSLEQLEDIIDNAERKNDVLFDNVTYEKFYEIYISTKNKYEMNIKFDDIINFMANTYDKNFRETIEAKEYNIKHNKKTDDIGKKYGLYIIVFGAAASIIMILYKVIFK